MHHMTDLVSEYTSQIRFVSQQPVPAPCDVDVTRKTSGLCATFQLLSCVSYCIFK